MQKVDIRVVMLRALVATVIVVLSLMSVQAEVMTSGSYKIYSDSINVGGGYATSTSYIQESTVGEVATGVGTSSSYELRAGYQQMQEVYLSLTSLGDVEMAPNLGLAGGTALGSTSFNVITDSPAGYSVSIAASNNPAMQSSFGTIANYVPVGAVPDFSFISGANNAFFGFSPEGSDIISRYKDNASACGVGLLDTSGACWDTVSTTAQVVAAAASANHPLGATTTLQFRITIGGSAGVTAGLYTATTTVTALPL